VKAQKRIRYGLSAVAAATVVSFAPALATVYETPGREVAIGTAGESVYGRYVAVSHGGDANSSNYTFVNGKKIMREEVVSGTKLQFGSVETYVYGTDALWNSVRA